MSLYFVDNSLKNNTFNEFSYKSVFRNMDSYYDFKKILNNRKYGEVLKPKPKEPLSLKYNGSLPFDHGNFNNEPETHKFFNLNRYIPPSYRDYEIGNKKGTLARVFERREKDITG